MKKQSPARTGDSYKLNQSKRRSHLSSSDTLVPGYEASQWFGIDKLNKGIQRWACRSQDQGAACRSGRHVAGGLAGNRADETEKWGKVVGKFAGLKPD